MKVYLQAKIRVTEDTIPVMESIDIYKSRDTAEERIKTLIGETGKEYTKDESAEGIVAYYAEGYVFTVNERDVIED